jgi:hypothetical protein
MESLQFLTRFASLIRLMCALATTYLRPSIAEQSFFVFGKYSGEGQAIILGLNSEAVETATHDTSLNFTKNRH